MGKYGKILFFLSVVLILLFSSCEKLFEETPGDELDKYLVSREQIKVISLIEINAAYAGLATLYPDLDVNAIKSKALYGVKIFKIKYNTVFRGDSIVSSGLVCVPIGAGTFPLMSFQNGTFTLHSDAPTVVSEDSDMGKLYLFLESVASTGFVIAIPDYIGFGESSDLFHPYLDKESTVQSLLDMLRATRELMSARNLKVNMSDDLYITGYSMGGWATLQLQKTIEASNPDGFVLKASACSAGPYDLLYINSYILNLETYPMPYFIGYMLNSYKKLGRISNNISDIINEPYASRIPTLYDGTIGSEQINNQLTTSVTELFTEAFRNGFVAYNEFSTVRQALMNNSIGAWNITTPLVLFHGASDDFIPPRVSEDLYQDMLKLGVPQSKVTLVEFPNTDHTGGIVPCEIASIKWFLDLKGTN